MTTLSGSLQGLPLERIFSVLFDARSSGVMRVAGERFAAEATFQDGQLVAVSCGAERGLRALEALMLALPNCQFGFSAKVPPYERNIFLGPDQLAARIAEIASESAAVRLALPSLADVPHSVLASQLPDRLEELRLDRATIQILLAADGSRSVEVLAHEYGLARTMRELARLSQAGLVRMDSPPAERRAANRATSAARRVRNWFVRDQEPPAHGLNGHVRDGRLIGKVDPDLAAHTDSFIRLGALMVRHRWLVVGMWLVVLAVTGGLLAPKAATVLKGGGFIVPGSESSAASGVLERAFGASPNHSVFVVFQSTDWTVDDPDYQAAVATASDRLRQVSGVRSVLTFLDSGDFSLVSSDRHVAVALVGLIGQEGQVQDLVPTLRDRLVELSVRTYVTGLPAVNQDVFGISEQDLRRSEVYTVPIVLILLLLVFRTVVASAIPLILGACGVTLTLAAVYLVGLKLDTSIFALNVASMIGLGLGIDFSLIMVNRFREERAAGREPAAAVAATMATAGRSITFSGVTVMLSMAVLTTLLAQLMIVRSISMAVMLVALMSVLAGLTLLPALLAVLGDRIDSLRVIPRPRPRRSIDGGVWYRLSHSIMRRPWAWLGASLLILLALAFPIREIALVGVSTGNLPSTAESVKGNRLLDDAFGAPRLTPIQIVVETGRNGLWKPEFLDGLQELNDTVAADPRVASVQSLATLARLAGVPDNQFRSLTPDMVASSPAQRLAIERVVNVDGDSAAALITVVSKYDQYDQRHQDLVRDLRRVIIPSVRQVRTYDVHVGGDAAFFLDFEDALYGHFPLIAAAVMLMNFVILMAFFRSIFLPLKAVLMNVMTIVATIGVLVLVFQHGVGASLIGFKAQGLLGSVTPAILYVILFGLSTDYEVFILSRVKEYYHALRNNEEAVATGLERTAGVVAAAGLILVATFGSFASADVVTIKEIGLGLAIGVLLDSTIVRVIMLPATMRLLGQRNWWMPAWLARLVPELHDGPAAAGPAPHTHNQTQLIIEGER